MDRTRLLVLLVCEDLATARDMGRVLQGAHHACVVSGELERTCSLLRQATPHVIVTTFKDDQREALFVNAPEAVPFVVVGPAPANGRSISERACIFIRAPFANEELLRAVQLAGGKSSGAAQ